MPPPKPAASPDGWTVVTRTGRRPAPAEESSPSSPPPPDPGTTLATLRAAHSRAASTWASCALRAELHAILSSRVPASPPARPLDAAVLLALGSLSGTGDGDDSSSGGGGGRGGRKAGRRAGRVSGPRCSVSMLQLAAFEDFVGTLRGRGHGLARAAAQDPAFNGLDAAFLAERGFEVLQAPAADALGGRGAFVFAPHAPRAATAGVLGCAWGGGGGEGPGVYVGNAVRDEYGVADGAGEDQAWAAAWLAARHECGLPDGGRAAALGLAEWVLHGTVVHWLRDECAETR